MLAKIKLRPTRIGFLVRPADRQSLEMIFQVNTALWGGVFNPIIPVFSRPPKAWRNDHRNNSKCTASQGYIRYFEPDVYVEAEAGLAEKVGLPAEVWRKENSRSRIADLQEFSKLSEHGRANNAIFGMTVSEIFQHTYDKERKFVLRSDHLDRFLTYTGSEYPLASKAIFGSYPGEASTKHFERNFRSVFEPEKVAAFDDTLRMRIFDHCASQISLTAEGLRPERFGEKDPAIFLFNPTSAVDLIDFWNLRAQGLGHVYPMPLKFFWHHQKEIQKLIADTYVPRTKHRFARCITIEFSRSIFSQSLIDKVQANFSKSQDQSICYKVWRDPIWNGIASKHHSSGVKSSRAFGEDRFSIVKTNTDDSVRIQTLSPEFLDRTTSNRYAWINSITINDTHHRNNITTTLPFNYASHIDLRPRSIDPSIVNSEGWCFPRQYSGHDVLISKGSAFEIFSAHFEKHGFTTKQSEAGIIASQMFSFFLEKGIGLKTLKLFSHPELLKLFNSHAMGQRVRSDGEQTKEESFPSKAITTTAFRQFIGRHSKDFSHGSLIKRLVRYGVVRLGVGVKCPNCFTENWYSLNGIDYNIECELCRQNFDFPQHEIGAQTVHWRYRLMGPFASPDYARGSYSVLLTARFLNEVSDDDSQLSFCPGVELEDTQGKCEADLVCWFRESGLREIHREPKLVFAECKSFASEALESRDFVKMNALARRFPDAVIVFAVLKNKFSSDEKDLLKEFLRDCGGRKLGQAYERPVIVLTGKDLFFEHFPFSGKDARYDHSETDDLSVFATATQRLNL